MLVNAGRDDCVTDEGALPYIPHVTTRTADKVHKLLYFYLSLWLKFMWLLLIQLLLPNHSTICPSSCLFLLLNLSVTFLIDIYEQRCCVHTTNFCLCVIQKKGMTLVIYCSSFVGEDSVDGSRPKKKPSSNHANDTPVPTSSRFSTSENPTRSAACRAEEKPHQRKWSFLGKMKFGMLPDRLVYIVFVCSWFSLVSSKWTNKLILVVTVSVCMLIHNYMRRGYR